MRKTLYEWRKERHVRPEQLAVAADVALRTIVNYEQGRTIPDALVARKIAAFLGVSEADIEWGVKPPSDDAEGKVDPAA